MKLFDYQKTGSHYLLTHQHCILGDDMGLGKTIQAIAAMDMLRLNSVIIICPAIVRDQWVKVIKDWSLCTPCVDIQPVYTTTDKITGRIVIISYALINDEYIFNQCKKIQWDLMVCDEAHYIKSINANRTVQILGNKGLIHNCKRSWYLTGTIITSRPMDLYPVLKVIAGNYIKPYTTQELFAKRYANGYVDRYGSIVADGASNLDELSAKLSKVMLRRTIEQVQDELPDIIFNKYNFKLDKVKQAVYDKYEQELAEEEYGKSQLRYRLGSLKATQLAEHIDMIISSPEVERLVVFYHHRCVGDMLAYRLSNTCKIYRIDGRVQKGRYDIVGNFLCSHKSVFLAQTDACHIGLDGLQKKCSYGYFAELPWTPDVFWQAVRRLARTGQEHKVFITLACAEGTYDENLLAGLKRKKKIVDKVMNNN